MGNYNFELDLDSINTMSIINHWIEPESNILEFGAANGRLTKYLKQEKKCEVTIVEIDEESGTEAAKYAKYAFLGEENGNIEKFHWCYCNEKYDYVIFADVLEHLSKPQEALIRSREVLKDTGKILVSIPNLSHNSIIIELIQDRFDYQKTGLLDKTHIHFFTHHTFSEMLRYCGLEILSVKPIYGRVGDIEIRNKYSDIPLEIEKYLRKRVPGSIYQYVYALEKTDSLRDSDHKRNVIEGFQLEEYVPLETQIFYRKKDEEFADDRRYSLKYSENENVIFSIDIKKNQNFTFLRWDPMEYSGVICLEDAFIEKDGEQIQLSVKNTNAYLINNNLFFFETQDPWVEFDEVSNEFEFMKITIKFHIVDLTGEHTEIIKSFVNQLYIDYEKKISSITKDTREFMENMIRDMKKRNAYIEHLENDINYLKAEVEKNVCLYNHTIESKVKRLFKGE